MVDEKKGGKGPQKGQGDKKKAPPAAAAASKKENTKPTSGGDKKEKKQAPATNPKATAPSTSSKPAPQKKDSKAAATASGKKSAKAPAKSAPVVAAAAPAKSAAKKGGKKEISKRAKVAPLPEVIAVTKSATTTSQQAPVRKSAGTKSADAVVPKKSKVDPMIMRRPKNFGIGGTIQPKRDLTRFVKWPRYIRIQRQRAVLYKRLKIPPPINQFRNSPLSKQSVTQVFKLLHSYRPETQQAKKERLRKLAEAKAAGKKVPVANRPPVVSFGTNDVTTLVEKKKAQLVVIAADCDPIEVVLHLPTLCRKMGVPYCIVKGGRPRLGHLVHRKTCSVVALTKVLPEDKPKLAKLLEVVKSSFNDRYDEIRRQWGGGQLGPKSKARKARLDKAKAKELSQKVAASVAL